VPSRASRVHTRQSPIAPGFKSCLPRGEQHGERAANTAANPTTSGQGIGAVRSSAISMVGSRALLAKICPLLGLPRPNATGAAWLRVGTQRSDQSQPRACRVHSAQTRCAGWLHARRVPIATTPFFASTRARIARRQDHVRVAPLVALALLNRGSFVQAVRVADPD
jgi:hypothetical protein